MVYEIYDCCQNSLCINWKNNNTMNCSLTKKDFINCKQVRYYHKKPLIVSNDVRNKNEHKKNKSGF